MNRDVRLTSYVQRSAIWVPAYRYTGTYGDEQVEVRLVGPG